MDYAEKAVGVLVMVCGNGAVIFDVTELALDASALLVECPIMHCLRVAMFAIY